MPPLASANSRPPRRAWPIRWWLTLLSASVSVPLLALLAGLYVAQVRYENAEARERSRTAARQIASRATEIERESAALLDAFGSRALSRQLDTSTCEGQVAFIDALPQYVDLLLFDETGTLVCAAGRGGVARDLALASRPRVAAAVHRGELRDGHPVVWLVGDEPVWISSTHLRQGGALRGTLVLSRLPDPMWRDTLPSRAVLTILDDSGTVLVRSADLQRWAGRNLRGLAIADVVLRQPDGVIEAEGPDRVKRQYGFAAVPDLRWHVLVGVPASETVEPVRRTFLRGMTGGLVIVLLAYGIAIALSRRIARSLEDVVAVASRFATGSFDRITRARGPLEVVKLATAFNDMVERRAGAELKMSEDEQMLKALSDRLLEVQEEERTRIARELHDDLGQSLTALKMDVEGLVQKGSAASEPVVTRILSTLDETLGAVQRISWELRPSALDDLGLVAAVEAEARRFEDRSGIECDVSFPSDPLVPKNCATAIFRIVQEALTNVARHSNASRVELRLREREATVLLEIRDDGRGITVDEITDPRSLGLVGIRERAALVGGTVLFEGVSGRGTIVSVQIPCGKEGQA